MEIEEDVEEQREAINPGERTDGRGNVPANHKLEVQEAGGEEARKVADIYSIAQAEASGSGVHIHA